MQVFPRMNFITEVYTLLVKTVENWQPALGQFPETGFHQPGGSLGPGIHGWPEQGPAERGMGTETQIPGGLGGIVQLLHRPLRSGLGIVPDFGRGKTVKLGIVGRVHSHQLSLQMGGEFSDLQSGFLDDPPYLIGISFAFSRLFEVQAPWIPGGYLYTGKSQALGPFTDRGQCIERGFLPHELGQEDGRSFDCMHD